MEKKNTDIAADMTVSAAEGGRADLPVSDNLIINGETLPVITQLAERIPGGFFIYHAGGDQQLIYFNSRLPAMFGCENDEEFRTLTGNSFKGIVHPEDYAASESDIKEQIGHGGRNIDHVKYRFIRKDGSIGMMDDYGHFSHSEAFGDIYYVFVQDVTGEYLEKQRTAQLELLTRVRNDYEGVFLIDCVNDTRRTIHDRLSGAAHYDDAENYSAAFSRYVEEYVGAPDREMMKGFADPANILRILGDSEEKTVTYRDRTTGVQRFYEMKMIRYSDTEVLQSFKENDAEMVNSFLFEKLKDNYFAILGVDLESGLLRSYKEDPLHITGGEGEISTLSSVMGKLASFYEGETRAFFERNSDPENIKKTFAGQDRAEYICRSANGEATRWVDITGIVFSRNPEGEPSLFCLAFNYLDERAAKVQDMQEQLGKALEEARKANAMIAEQQRLAGKAEQARKEQIAKTAGTESTYIVDPETERFQILGQNEYLAGHYTEAEDFNTSFSRYIATDVFGPDRKAVAEAITVPAMVSHLKEEEEYVVRYRDISKGVPRWFEMRAVRLSDNEILYGFSDKDEEIITQMMAASFRETYFGLYYINLDSEIAQIIKTGHPEITGEVGSYRSYSRLMDRIASGSYGEAAEFFKKISDIGYIKNRFADEDYAYHVYKSYIFEGNRWVNYTGRVLQRHSDGTPSVFALALSLLDEEATEKEEAKVRLRNSQRTLEEQVRTIKESNRVIGALSNDYSCVMYVEIHQDKMQDIGAEVRVSELMKQLVPGWEETDRFSKKLDLLLNNLVYEADRKQFYDGTRREVILGKLKNADNYYLNTRFLINGEMRYYQVHFASVKENGNAVGFVAGLRSIDEQMKQEIRTQQQLEAARIAAEASNRSKTNFLFNMSHDIRTPMNAITGFTKMAKKQIGDREKVTEYLDKIDTAGQQLLELINQVLEMARIESGKVEFKEHPVNIMEQYNAAVTVLAEQAEERGLEFHHSLSDAVHMNVFADTAKMNSITLNITGNAMKYTPRGGRIDYSLREIPSGRPGYATYVFTVADTGIGMSKEFLATLYEPFTREQNSTISKIQGTGLGMSIVKNLVDSIGGRIEVRSEHGKGTRFDITADFRINEEAERKAGKKQRAKKISFAGKKVLLVEDNEMNRDIATDILEDEKLEVETAADGSVAVEMMREKGPDYYDFILMDIQMPVMNGYEATETIRKMYPDKHIPIIALSANAFAEDKAASLAAGMDDHVAKPINIPEMFGAISKHI